MTRLSLALTGAMHQHHGTTFSENDGRGSLRRSVRRLNGGYCGCRSLIRHQSRTHRYPEPTTQWTYWRIRRALPRLLGGHASDEALLLARKALAAPSVIATSAPRS